LARTDPIPQCNSATQGGTVPNVDVDDLVGRGDIFQQTNGRRVYVLSNADGTPSAVILDGALTTDPLRTVLESVSDSSLAKRIADGRWTPIGDL